MRPWLVPVCCAAILTACDPPPAPPAPAPPAASAAASATGTSATTSAPRAVAETVPLEHAKADLQALATELPKRHKDLFFRLTEAQWKAAVQQLEAELPRLTKVELAARFAALVASVGDGHTELGLDSVPGFRRYPIELYAFADGLYITSAAQEHAAFRGKRVTRIGNLEAGAAQTKVAPLIARDNAAALANRVPVHLVIPEVLQAVGIVANPEKARFETDGGTLEVQPVQSWREVTWAKATETLPHYRRKPQLHYWNDYLAEANALYFKYNACAEDKSSDMTFAQLVKGSFGFVKQNSVTRFVIDLRNNGGGDSRIAAPLIDALAAHPTLNQRGHLYLIIGRQTFSSALLNTIELQQKTAAITVGEPTGGKPNHYGEVKRFTLPHSGWTVSYSTKVFTTAQVEGDPDSIRPDVPVKVTGKDFFAGRDPVLEAALAHRP